MSSTVLIVDDHPGFRSWTRSLLETEGFTVIGEAGDGASAVARAQELHPQVVLLDVMLPDTSGFDVAIRLGALPRRPQVVLISSREGCDFGPALQRAIARPNVRGFICKADLTGAGLLGLLETE